MCTLENQTLVCQFVTIGKKKHRQYTSPHPPIWCTPTLAKINSYREPHGQVRSQVYENSVRSLKHLSYEFYSFTWTIKAISFISISRPASWSSGHSFWLLITRSRVRFPALPWGFSLWGRIPVVTMVWVVSRFRLKVETSSTRSQTSINSDWTYEISSLEGTSSR